MGAPCISPSHLTSWMQAPHHSALSWSLYWARHAEVEKVYNAAKNLGTTKRTMRAGLRRRNLARRSPTSDRGDTREDSSSGAESTSGDLSDWQSDPDTDADVAALGGHGDPWASADKRVMARWIAAQPADWKQHPRKDRFTGFLQKVSHVSSGSEAVVSIYSFHVVRLQEDSRELPFHVSKQY